MSSPIKSVWSSASRCFSSSFVFSCALLISVLKPKSSALVFFPDISKSVFIAVALFICSLSTLSCFTDIFGTSVPKLIPPPIFSYLFLSSKSFTTTLLADTFNFSFSLSEPITAPIFVRLSVSIFPPFLAINVVCLFTHSFSPLSLLSLTLTLKLDGFAMSILKLPPYELSFLSDLSCLLSITKFLALMSNLSASTFAPDRVKFSELVFNLPPTSIVELT